MNSIDAEITVRNRVRQIPITVMHAMMNIVEEIVVERMHTMVTVMQMRVGVRTRANTNHEIADVDTGMPVVHRVAIRIQRRPEIPIMVPVRRHPRRPPHVIVAPKPSVVMVVRPTAIV